MEFIFETIYDQKGISVMAEALRKTIRRKRSKRSRIWAVIIIIFALIISFPQKEEFVLKSNTIITWIVVAIMIVVLLFEDKINGYIARKRIITGMNKSITTFKEESYISETNIGKTEFYYDNIKIIAETNEYFIFIFDQSHAQIYDKNGLKSGTLEEFKSFIERKTETKIEKIK